MNIQRLKELTSQTCLQRRKQAKHVSPTTGKLFVYTQYFKLKKLIARMYIKLQWSHIRVRCHRLEDDVVLFKSSRGVTMSIRHSGIAVKTWYKASVVYFDFRDILVSFLSLQCAFFQCSMTRFLCQICYWNIQTFVL